MSRPFIHRTPRSCRRRSTEAGLDVFAQEPPAPDNPLLRCANAIVTPHIAAGTRDAYETKLRAVFANMERVARGEAPRNEVRS